MPGLGDIVKYAASESEVTNYALEADTDYVALVVAESDDGVTLRVFLPNGRDIVASVSNDAEEGSAGSIVGSGKKTENKPPAKSTAS